MYLTIDFGNTASKYALFSEGGILRFHGVFTDVESLLQWEGMQGQALAACIFSTVRKDIPWLTGLDCAVHLFSSIMKLPVTMGYHTPETLGADRLAGVLGAQCLMQQRGRVGASLVIDAGTCITYDWLDEGGCYQGGSISPGLHMRYLALHQQTGKLPLVSHEAFSGQVGKSTHESILCGVQQGIAGESHRQIALFLEKHPEGQVFITGGDGLFLAEQQKTEIFVEPMLVHYGLMHALQHHEKAQ
ncbi:MAG: type III pantothenate kinase [Bacteroidetes bacterium]|nr:type III pantothenate kinase [Bacteroidota bacterium]